MAGILSNYQEHLIYHCKVFMCLLIERMATSHKQGESITKTWILFDSRSWTYFSDVFWKFEEKNCCFSTFPAYEERISQTPKFWLTFLGQSIIALGHPFLITMSTKVSQVWFAERERMLTTAAMAGAPALGAAIGSVVAPIIVSEKSENIPYLNLAFPALGLVRTYSISFNH